METSITKRRNHMKRILAIGMFCSLSGLSAWAAPQTLTGQISDSMCGKSHSGMGDMGKNPKECTLGRVSDGGKYVFVSGDNGQALKNRSFVALSANAGATLQFAGDALHEERTIWSPKLRPPARGR